MGYKPNRLPGGKQQAPVSSNPVSLTDTAPFVNEIVQESRELYYASLNEQMDAPLTGATGVEVAHTAAIYIPDIRITLVNEGFSFLEGAGAGTRIATSASWTVNATRIFNLVSKYNKLDFSQYTDYARTLYLSGLFENKILGLSLWNLTLADFEHEAAKFIELRKNPHRYPVMAIDDEEYRGHVANMSEATWSRAKKQLEDWSGQLKEKYGKWFGIYKPFVDAYIFNHRCMKVTKSYVNIARQQKRERFVMPGMSHAVVRPVLHASYTAGDDEPERNTDVNGLFCMEDLFEWLMEDVEDFSVLVEILERKGDLSWLIDSVDTKVLGTGMFKNIRRIERSIDEPLFYLYSQRFIVTNADGNDPISIGFLENALHHKWFGTVKPTWFAFIHNYVSIDGDTVNCCIYENYLMDATPGILNLTQADAASRVNVMKLTYKQVDNGHGNADEDLEWAEMTSLNFVNPYMSSKLGTQSFVLARTQYVNNPAAFRGQHTSDVGELCDSFEVEPEDQNLMQADVPAAMYYNANGIRGHVNYLEHFLRGTLGSFDKNVYRRNYEVSGAKRQLARGEKRMNNKQGDKLTKLDKPTPGNTIAEDTVDMKPDIKDSPKKAISGRVPDDQWAKMSPAERAKVIAARKDGA